MRLVSAGSQEIKGSLADMAPFCRRDLFQLDILDMTVSSHHQMTAEISVAENNIVFL